MGVELCIGRHEVVVWVMIIQAVAFIVPGQAVCHSVGVTVHMLDGEAKARQVFPPPSLLARQARLSLKVREALMVSYYDEFSP